MNDLSHLSFSEADLIEIDRISCKESFGYFVRQAWHVLEPATQLKWGWALDAICDHLTAVSRGEILQLLMNVPPGTMKSLLVGVFFPAWEWGPLGRQHLRYLGTAHKEPLAIRDSAKCRFLIKSEWYQKRWRIAFNPDQDGKSNFANMRTGFVEAMAFNSMTGSRGDRVRLDDPNSVDDANSEVKLESTRLNFLEALPSRVNNDSSAIIVIMQRLHELDVSGTIIEKELGYDHLCIPMRYEADRIIKPTSIGWTDPRTEDGQLMFPERFPEEQVAALEATLGTYATAGQLQQRPAPRGGGMFKREWFHVVNELPDRPIKWIRAWDLAATEGGDGPRTAGCLMGLLPNDKVVIADIVKGRWAPSGVERTISDTAKDDGTSVEGSIPQDPGAAGKAWGQDIIAACKGYVYKMSPETGDKETRAQPLAAQAEAGNVYLLNGPWIKDFFEEAEKFPTGRLKDQVDAASRAYMELTKPSASCGILLSSRQR